MKLLLFFWLSCLCPALTRGSANVSAYGYAPFVWVRVSTCSNSNGWCLGSSLSGFALTVDTYDRANDTCTHYCPGEIYAHWKPFRLSVDFTKTIAIEHRMLGAYVRRLDKSSCLVVPGGFKCSDRVVSDTPLNRISIMLHASPDNRDYYFNRDPMFDCGADPQCAAFKLLRRTLFAPAESRRWPSADEVLTLRNSAYACVLSYVGLGNTENINACYTQLGNNCFLSEGNRFCIGNSQNEKVGITNADSAASAPIAICEVSSAGKSRDRDRAYKPTATEIRDFLIPSSCDAAVISLDRAVYMSNYLSVELDVAAFFTVAEAGHVIMKVSFDECLVPVSSASGAFPLVVSKVAEKLSRVKVSTHSSAIMLDATGWGLTDCDRTSWKGTDFNKAAADLASALIAEGVSKLFLQLPKSIRFLATLDFSRLAAFEAFVTPRGSFDMDRVGHCQNMWTATGERGNQIGVMPYVLTLLRKGVRANKVIFTLSLTGGLKISSLETKVDRERSRVSELSLADMETNTMLTCEEDLDTKCCSGSSLTVWTRNVLVNLTVTTTSFETLRRFPELVAVAFGINQFLITPVDSDFKRDVRSNTPAILGITSAVHRLRDWKRQQMAAGISTAAAVSRSRQKRAASAANGAPLLNLDNIALDIPESPYKDPASGAKNCLDPEYNIGLSNTVLCPGLTAVHGALGVFGEPHREMYSTSYDKIYVANLYELESCTPGPPGKRASVSKSPPQIAVNINTLIPTTDPNHYMVGILDSQHIVEYMPPVSKVCGAANTGEITHSMNLVSVDDGYAVDKPVVEAEHGVIVKPVEALYFVSNFTPGIDYINLNVSCVNYDVSALRPCLISICGGDNGCRRDYGRLCNSAHEIVNDARRAGQLMEEGLDELALQERKARAYELPDSAPFPWLEKPSARSRGRGKRLAGLIVGTAALGLATWVSTRVDGLEKQMDSMKNEFVKYGKEMVEVSRKLDANIAMVNARIDQQEEKMKKNNEILNRNFAVLRDAMVRNTEMAVLDTNIKFSVMASYQMWYAEMQSVTHQMTQAAMHTKFMARGVENCLRQIASKRSGSCPSGMRVLQEHPGLSEFPTVGTALYKDRKLFIVHSVPGTVEKTVVRGVIPMPRMSTDGVPCWPDYKVWLIDGQYYQPSECHGRYCRKPELHERYRRCTEEPGECKTVCAPCHRGICYRDRKVTWMEGAAMVEIQSPPLRSFSRPHISEGPISFSDLLKNAVPGTPEIDLVKTINTSAKLISVREDLDNITRSLEEFDKRYDEMTAGRVTFGGLLSGFASDMALWVCVAVLLAWCVSLSCGLAYLFYQGHVGGRGGERGFAGHFKKRRTKIL